jgi:F-type H+-transporting ATPase subunit delta
MIEGSLSRRYTRALFQLAAETQQEEKTGQEVEEFYGAYRDSELQAVLTSPAFSAESRRKVLLRVIESQKLSALTTNFLSLLLERDRLSYLPSIVASYRRFLNQAKGRVEAKVVAAGELQPALVEQLKQTLRRISGKEIVIHEEHDPTLIGGLVVELEGKVYDGSVRTQLDIMRQRIAREY